MKAALRWIVSNLPLMVLSLILASLAWVVAVEQEDPTQEGLYQAIPVTLSGLPPGMVIVGNFNEHVEVTVRAPNSVLSALRVEDFAATVDLTHLDAGVYQIPIQVTLAPRPSQVVRVEPEYVTLELDSAVERSVSVRVPLEGQPTLGYVMRTMTVNPRQVTVSGPSTYVTRVVEAVIAPITVQNANADIEGEFQLQPRDSGGQPVPYVTLTPTTVHVRIPIELSGDYRFLAVKPDVEGLPAAGYRIANITVSQLAVTVSGARDVLAALPGFIETEPINVEGAQADVIVRPALLVPSDVILAPNQQVEVKILVEAIQSSLKVEVAPEPQGLDPDLAAAVSPETVEIILSGPLPLLETLEAGDVRVVLDLFGLGLGTHQIEPQVVAPEGTTVQSILPATVQVEITPAPTPTPTPTPTGS